jgi:dATP pyrophosphohydrolase
LPHKLPVSTLVLVHTADLRVLLLERADFPGYWQSVTGSQETGETLAETARRELHEETAIEADRHGGVLDWNLSNVYEIYPQWRFRYPDGTTHNTEHVFSVEVPEPVPVVLNPREHLAHDCGVTVFQHACALGCEGIVSKRLGSRYRSGR